MLTQLAGALDGQLFSSVVWRMTLDPDAAAAAAAARSDAPPPGPDDSNGARGAARQPAELPYHRCLSPCRVSCRAAPPTRKPRSTLKTQRFTGEQMLGSFLAWLP